MATGSELFELLAKLRLPSGHYAVFGSGPLLVRGIIDVANDLDVICRRQAWTRAAEVGELVHLDDLDVDIVSVFGGLITLGRSWGYGDFDIDELIETAETIAGLPFVRLEHVVAFKRVAGRPKDLAHLEALAAWDAERGSIATELPPPGP